MPTLRFALLTILFTLPSFAADVKIIPLPDGALVPDVLVDKRHIVHLVYGLGDNAYYTRSIDNGKTFSDPIKVNSEGKVQLTMGERGPKLALGANDSIHVVYVDRWSPGANCYVRHARSLNGKTFEPAQQISPMPAVDGATLAADGLANVLVFWHVFLPPQDEIPQAHSIYLSASTNDGRTFADAQRLKLTDSPNLACSMCMMRAQITDGHVYLAFRAADNNIRDFYVLKSPTTENNFIALRVNDDNWKLETCPMCGPELTLAPDGTAIAAFMSRHKVYFATAERPYTKFRLHIPTPKSENDEIYPAAFANADSKVLFLWQVGPMSTTARATVKYALYTLDGKPLGEETTLGTTTSATKPTAFVGSDDNFYILTTAR
ncbi:MAG: sialidase family protein [Planctomycetota bacterium]|nr:sialidase family protein [Planctomycetota bacterium]